jgi:hypothetical protein
VEELFESTLQDEIDKFIQSKDDWRYSFITVEELKNLTTDQQMKQYWIEILKRSVLSSLLALCKLNHWAVAVQKNIETKNYYSFCASLRGYIESCADTIYSLSKVPLTIANDFKAIFNSIHNFEGAIIFHEPLENELIHYLQARKLSKEELKVLPSAYQSKNIAEYLRSINDLEGDVNKLYSYLCGIAHPSSNSNGLFLFDSNNHLIICGDSGQFEIKLIEIIINENHSVLNRLFKITAFYAFELLELVNKFLIEELSVITPKRLAIRDQPAWAEIENLIVKSKIRYEKALQTGKYE